MSLNQHLLAAAIAGETSRCLELIASNANINVVDAFGWTPLMRSISYSHIDTAMALLDAKADVAVRDEDGRKCLDLAVEYGDLALCRTLVEHDADVNATDKHGYTPLITAACYGRADVCVYLSNAGARVDAKTEWGETALQLAVLFNKTDAVTAIQRWLKDRDAAAAFTRGTKHAYDTYQADSWTMNPLFDINLIGEITSFVTPTPTVKVQ